MIPCNSIPSMANDHLLLLWSLICYFLIWTILRLMIKSTAHKARIIFCVHLLLLLEDCSFI
uniref:Uncharacterized protein n=1 Tax=Arundo donax TaxID=35708 RepID=A0A0A9ALU3_ARUDO